MDIESKILNFLQGNKTVVLATIYKKAGSVPRGPGAKLLVVETGEVFGTIGGGSVEKKTIDFAKDFFNKNKKSDVLRFNLAPGKDGENIDMICGGKIDILIEKIEPNKTNISVFKQYVDLCKTKEKGIWIIDITLLERENISKRFLVSNENFPEVIPKELIEKVMYKDKFINKNRILNISDKIFFVDPFMKKGNLILTGAGHIAAELSKLASKVDFNIIVIDDRSEFANQERFPDASEIIIVDDFENVYDIYKKYDNAYLVILTRAHLFDQTVLEQALKTDSVYVGMIGSKKKRDTIYKNLYDKGISYNILESVYSPIGLDIGAQTPEEIAVSITAELIQKRAKGI
jgi:xanthine dehydrogenase accessory factor